MTEMSDVLTGVQLLWKEQERCLFILLFLL